MFCFTVHTNIVAGVLDVLFYCSYLHCCWSAGCSVLLFILTLLLECWMFCFTVHTNIVAGVLDVLFYCPY